MQVTPEIAILQQLRAYQNLYTWIYARVIQFSLAEYSLTMFETYIGGGASLRWWASQNFKPKYRNRQLSSQVAQGWCEMNYELAKNNGDKKLPQAAHISQAAVYITWQCGRASKATSTLL